jgi:hypothetical protein
MCQFMFDDYTYMYVCHKGVIPGFLVSVIVCSYTGCAYVIRVSHADAGCTHAAEFHDAAKPAIHDAAFSPHAFITSARRAVWLAALCCYCYCYRSVQAEAYIRRHKLIRPLPYPLAKDANYR